MKRTLSIFLFLSSFLSADFTHWHGSYDKALALAYKEKKPLLVLVVKKECIACNNTIKNYFANQPYIEELNKKAVSVIVTYEGLLSYPVEMFYTTTFPTLFVINSQTETFLSKPLYKKMIDEKSINEIILKI